MISEPHRNSCHNDDKNTMVYTHVRKRDGKGVSRLCRKSRPGFERPFSRLPASGSIDDKANIACFAVFARRKNCSLSGRRWTFPTEPSPPDGLRSSPVNRVGRLQISKEVMRWLDANRAEVTGVGIMLGNWNRMSVTFFKSVLIRKRRKKCED